MHCADPYTKNTHLSTLLAPREWGCTEETPALTSGQCRSERSSLIWITAENLISRSLVLHNHPRRTTWTVPKPLPWKKVCFLPLQINNSFNPLFFFFIFSLNTCSTKRYLYNLWCYHYTHTYSNSLVWMSTAECQETENKQIRIKSGEWRESRSWRVLHILHYHENWFWE